MSLELTPSQISGDVVLATLGDDTVAEHLAASLARSVRGLVQAAILDASQDLQQIGGFDLIDWAIPKEGEDHRLENPDGLGIRRRSEILLLHAKPLACDRLEGIGNSRLLCLSAPAEINALREQLPRVFEFLSRKLR